MGDTPLFCYLRETKGLLCLQCVLEDCDETDPSCLYRTMKDRKEYWREYYKENRTRKLGAAKARNNANRKEYLTYQKNYRKKRSKTNVIKN